MQYSMGKYGKAWSTAIGGVLGLGAAYGLVPEDINAQTQTVIVTVVPLIAGILGTILGPKNTN